jgi:hypothetical protein
MNPAAAGNNDGIKLRRVLHIHLRFNREARLSYAGLSADANCHYSVATALTTIIGCDPGPREYLGWSHQIDGRHLLKDYDSDESWDRCLTNLLGATEERSGAPIKWSAWKRPADLNRS